MSKELIGRQATLKVLLDCFSVCMDRTRVGVAVITGEAGLGATSVLEALEERLIDVLSKGRVFYVLTPENDEPFSLLRYALLKLLDLDQEQSPKVNRLRLIERIGRTFGFESAAKVNEASVLMGHVAGIPFPKGTELRSLKTDPAAMEQRIFEVLKEFLEADMASSPTAFLFDDMHLAKKDSLLFTLNVLKSLSDVPLVVIAAGRPKLCEMIDIKDIVHIPLDPLDDKEMSLIFQKLMPKVHNSSKDLIDAALGKAKGNPGSLVEICADLVKSGVTDISTDQLTTENEKLLESNLPMTSLDAFKIKLEQLDTRDISVLETAAVFGEVFFDGAIVALLRQYVTLKKDIKAAQIWADDADRLAVSSSLERLEERQFIVRLPDKDIEGCIKYAFFIPSIRNEIIRGMDKAKLSKGHILAAQWLSHTTSKANHVFLEAEAAHWAAASEMQRASYTYFKAASSAKACYLNQKAIKLFQRGIELSNEMDKLALADALYELGSIYDLLGDLEEAEKCFTAVLKNAWILMHRIKAGRALNRIGRLYIKRSDSIAGRAFLNRGLTLLKTSGDDEGVAVCLGDLGELAMSQGAYDRALELVQESLALQQKANNKLSIAQSLHCLGQIEAAKASFDQAERYYNQALEIRRKETDEIGISQTQCALASLLFNRGNVDYAIVGWEETLALAKKIGDLRMIAEIENSLGEAFMHQGRLKEALSHFKASEETALTLNDQRLLPQILRNMGMLSQKTGNIESARKYLSQSLELCKKFGVREMEGLAYRVIGEIESATMWDTSNVNGEDAAEQAFRRALDIFKSIGNDFEAARTMHAMGNRYLEIGDLVNGTKLLKEAEPIFKRIDSKASDKISRTISEITGRKPLPSSR